MDSLYFLIPGVIVASVILYFINKAAIKGLDKAFYGNKWKDIEKLLDSGEMGLRLAVIEADKLLDHALIAKGFSGKTMGERMKSANSNLKSKDDVWSAHKLRNRLVHEQDVKLSGKQARNSLNSFKKALNGLGAL